MVRSRLYFAAASRPAVRPFVARPLTAPRLVGLLASLLALAAPTDAQPIDAWTRLHVGDGLAHNSVYAIHQDRLGFMWFGTLDGLDRYDGYAFVSFRHDPSDSASLPHNLVRALHEDPDGTLWVGTQNGLARRGPRATGFERFAVPPDPGTGDRSVFDIGRDHRGTLWVATAGGLLRHVPTEGRLARALGGVFHGLALHGDTLWVLRGAAPEQTGTLLRIDLRRQRVVGRWRVEETLGTPLAIDVDSEGRPWLSGEGPVGFRGNQIAEGLADYTTRVVERASSGDIWIGGVGSGVRRCRRDGCVDALVDPARPDWIHNYVRAVAEDRTGAIWVGTYGGVYRWDPARAPFRTIGHRPRDPASLSTPAVSALAEDADGRLWVGSFDGGLDRLDPQTGRVERFGAGTDRGAVLGGIWSLLADSKGRLWGAGGLGLARINTETGQTRVVRAVSERLGGAVATSLAEDAEGGIWVASFGGLVRVDPATNRVVSFPVTGDARGPRHPTANVVRADGSAVWVGQPWGGLERIDLRTGRFETVPLSADGEERLSGEATYDLLPDGRGGIWVATTSGLTLTRPDRGVVRHLTTADGLPGTVVYSIQPDARGHLWLGTSRGLARFDPAGDEVVAYDLTDGIGMMEFNRAARLSTQDGQLWLGGAEGIVGFDPAALRMDLRAPSVALAGVEVSSRSHTRYVDPRTLDRLVLGASERTFAATFSALTYSDPQAIRYAYQLEGLDNGWVEAGTQRHARYTALPPGDYTLRVRAITPSGVLSEPSAVLPVRVTPRLWETMWVRGLAVLALLSIGVLAYRARVGRLLAVERLRLRIAGDLHDDLSSDLSGIALATDLLGRRPGLAPSDRQRLADVRDAATQMVDALRDIVWAVDPAHDSVEAFGRRVRLVAQRMLEGHEHTIDIDLGGAAVPLPMATRRELMLIVKEALHNVVRHAQATHVSVSMHRDAARLRLSVSDDGVGFDRGAVHDGHGLGSLQSRAERIGGRLGIESAPGAGTRVSLAVDLAKSREARRRPWALPWAQRPPSS